MCSHSRLLLKAKQLDELPAKDSILARFAIHGIARERLMLSSQVAREHYLASHHEIDIALDPFPYPGITTSVESLWMGVPVLTLAGNTFLARQGVGILMNAGLPDWIAISHDDYLARALRLANDLPRLAALRAGLRDRISASALFDTARFARNFETALREMWTQWKTINKS